MTDPVVLLCPPPQTTGAAVTLDTAGFDKKLAVTDNLVQELATAFDEHTHTVAELTAFLPPDDNLTDLGSGAKRWAVIYAGTGVINTSDRRFKTDIEPIHNGWDWLNAFDPVTFRFIDGKRTHLGFIAQDVKAKLPKDAAVFCEDNGTCGLRYEQVISPLVACVKDLKSDVDTQACMNKETRDELIEIIDDMKHRGNKNLLEFRRIVAELAESDKAFEKLVEEMGKDWDEGRAEFRAMVDEIAGRPVVVDLPKQQEPSKLPMIFGLIGMVAGVGALVLSMFH